jgi:hypothetical protein
MYLFERFEKLLVEVVEMISDVLLHRVENELHLVLVPLDELELDFLHLELLEHADQYTMIVNFF